MCERRSLEQSLACFVPRARGRFERPAIVEHRPWEREDAGSAR